jgi:hypothetical protein
MFKFYGEAYLRLADMLARIEQAAKSLDPKSLLSVADRKTTVDQLQHEAPHVQEAGLELSLMALRRLVGSLSHNDAVDRIQDHVKDLQSRLHDELLGRQYFGIARDREPFLNSRGVLFGPEVERAFPSTVLDIEEAGKCLAFDRYTASVYHLMRVCEVALDVLAKSLRVKSNSPNWQPILDRISLEITKKRQQKSRKWLKSEPFYAGALAHLQGVKTAWRNPTMHVARIYTPEVAFDIFSNVVGLMRHLATKLHE